MTGETERISAETLATCNEASATRPGELSPGGLVQGGAAGFAAGDEPIGRIARGIGLYLHALRRHWLLAIVFGFLCAIASSIVVWLLASERHTAVAVLRISANEKQLVFQTAERATAFDFEIYKGTQQQLLTSDVVSIAALHNPTAASQSAVQNEDDPACWLARNLRVELPPNSEIMRVSLTTRQPDEAAILLGAVIDAYMNEIVDADRRRQQDRLNDLDRLYSEKEAEMRKRRTALKQLAEQLGTGDTGALAMKQQIAMQQYAEARYDLSRLRADLQRAEDDLQGKRAWLKVLEAAPISGSDLRTAADPALTRLSEQIEEIDGRLAAVQRKLTGPLLAKVSAEYAQTKQMLVEKMAKQEKELEARLQKARNQNPEIVELRSRVEMLRVQEGTATKDLDEQRAKAERLGNSSIDVEMMRSELQYLDKVLAPIADEREKLKVELRSTPRISVFQRPEPRKTPDGGSRLQNAARAGVGGFFAAVLLVLSWDVRKQRINSLADLSRGLGLTVVGVLPLVPQKSLRAGCPDKHYGKGQNSSDHAVDSIAARLFLRKDAEGVKVVMVSSATAEEGKTALAVQLATRLARSGKPTLLVDYDLRRPSIHRIFDVPRGPGVSECLRQECDLGQVVHRIGAENLAVITAGAPLLESLGPLANGATTAFFTKARAGFAFVVVDGSPILPVIDGLLVSQHADTVVLSVCRDTSRGPQVLRACEKLSDFGSQKHVAVLTGGSEEACGDYQDHVPTPPVEAAEAAEAANRDVS